MNPEEQNQQQMRYFEQELQRGTPFVQNDPDLIFAFSEPEAKNYNKEFSHISRDIRMSHTSVADRDYLNIAYPLKRDTDVFLSETSQISLKLSHDTMIANNASVGAEGWGMDKLVTRTQRQIARITQDSSGFFKKKEPIEGQP